MSPEDKRLAIDFILSVIGAVGLWFLVGYFFAGEETTEGGDW